MAKARSINERRHNGINTCVSKALSENTSPYWWRLQEIERHERSTTIISYRRGKSDLWSIFWKLVASMLCPRSLLVLIWLNDIAMKAIRWELYRHFLYVLRIHVFLRIFLRGAILCLNASGIVWRYVSVSSRFLARGAFPSGSKYSMDVASNPGLSCPANSTSFFYSWVVPTFPLSFYVQELLWTKKARLLYLFFKVPFSAV